MFARLHMNATNLVITGGRLSVVPTNTATNWGSDGSFGGESVVTTIDMTTAKTLAMNVTPSINDPTLDWRLLSVTADLIKP